ncbi:RNA-guided endonuclease IscB [Pyrinomonas methylaliphatogenes]|uniref:Restriction endonuclease n=1 Tax=Pyrinomonas methylaliphatogenes TaxID=454194 RepID=A0A0B6WU01_9BACT|nr:RNA-guided endonuclease IscB [Pyrinomonas methylaliphatogenes]CDM64703.1 restriction endonuclease [Pyrinomonas methylaliphatogenes]
MVFVLDKHKKPLMHCTEKRARLLLRRGRAVVHRLAPFTIRLKDRVLEDSEVQPLRLKLDPGSKVTGVAVLRGNEVVFLGEIRHRTDIEDRLAKRRMIRRNRRNRKTRYRKPRFLNRHPEKCAGCGKNAKHGSRYCRKCGQRPKDNGNRNTWLPPSLGARVDQVIHALRKIRVPIGGISVELVRFDTQKLENPEISGVEYQHGTLFGYEVKEYLLQKFGHRCAYCGGESGDPVLEVEHVVPRSRGGSNRVSNLAIACRTCNEEKDDWMPGEWLAILQRSKRKLDRVRAVNVQKALGQLKVPLRDAAAANTTRWALYRRLLSLGSSVKVGSGGRTKWNRERMGLPKEHYWDAACVGDSTPEKFRDIPAWVQVWEAKGRGNRQVCRTDKQGFPVRHLNRQKRHFGFQTGDMVVAEIPRGKYAGRWRGRVAVRANGWFDLFVGGVRAVQGVSHKHCRVLQRGDGWAYEQMRPAVAAPPHA